MHLVRDGSSSLSDRVILAGDSGLVLQPHLVILVC
jgi:hypothetical protein